MFRPVRAGAAALTGGPRARQGLTMGAPIDRRTTDHDLSPALSHGLGHLYLPAGRARGRRGAHHRPGAGAGGALPHPARRARPDPCQGGGYPRPCRSHQRHGGPAGSHEVRHRDGPGGAGGRGLHAGGRRRSGGDRRGQPARAAHAGAHGGILQLRHGGPGLQRGHAADPGHRPHRLPERRSAPAVCLALRQAAHPARGGRWSTPATTTRATR